MANELPTPQPQSGKKAEIQESEWLNGAFVPWGWKERHWNIRGPQGIALQKQGRTK